MNTTAAHSFQVLFPGTSGSNLHLCCDCWQSRIALLRDWNSLYICSAKSSRSCITYSNPFLYPLILFCLFLCLICIQPTTPGPTGCWPHHIHWRTECLLQRCLWLRPPYRGALPAGQGRPPCSQLSPVAKHIRGLLRTTLLVEQLDICDCNEYCSLCLDGRMRRVRGRVPSPWPPNRQIS